MSGTHNKPAARWNPWPGAIIIYFIVFISAMVAWVVYASRQHVELVRNDYYEKEILFQQQIDAAQRGKRTGLTVAYDGTAVTVHLPAAPAPAAATGTIHFYRPNDARMDREVPMRLATDGTQRVDAHAFARGLWKVSVSWRLDGQDYYFDQPLVIGGKS